MSEPAAAPAETCPSCFHALVDPDAACPECGMAAEARHGWRRTIGRFAGAGGALLLVLGTATAFGAVARLAGLLVVPPLPPPRGTLEHWIWSNVSSFETRQQWEAVCILLVAVPLLVRVRRTGRLVAACFWTMVLVGVAAAITVAERHASASWRYFIEVPAPVRLVALAGGVLMLGPAGLITCVAGLRLRGAARLATVLAGAACVVVATTVAAEVVLRESVAWSRFGSAAPPDIVRALRPLQLLMRGLMPLLPLALLVVAIVTADLVHSRVLLVLAIVAGGVAAAAGLNDALSPWLPVPRDLVPSSVRQPALLVFGVTAVIAGARLGALARRAA